LKGKLKVEGKLTREKGKVKEGIPQRKKG